MRSLKVLTAATLGVFAWGALHDAAKADGQSNNTLPRVPAGMSVAISTAISDAHAVYVSNNTTGEEIRAYPSAEHYRYISIGVR